MLLILVNREFEVVHLVALLYFNWPVKNELVIGIDNFDEKGLLKTLVLKIITNLVLNQVLLEELLVLFVDEAFKVENNVLGIHGVLQLRLERCRLE